MTETPLVGIVTRTKNRPVLLKRAIESVVFQTYANWNMVIVNDGGDPAPIEALIAHHAEAAAGRITLVNNPRSLGMEGASAVGIAATNCELLAIHDDDDSWAPAFLTVAIAELAKLQREYPSVQGVTTYCNLVMEHVHGQVVRIESVEPFNDERKPGFLSLDRMTVSNVLPPISFLFTREAFDALGGVYEAIPYLGDWDFLVRFLSKYEVYMVPQFLAFYHWRTRTDSAWLGNTVTGEIDRHQFYRQLLLNQWLRRDLEAGRFGVGVYANLRSQLQNIAHQNDLLLARAPVAPAVYPVAAPPEAAPAPAAESPPPDAAATPPAQASRSGVFGAISRRFSRTVKRMAPQ